jgi:hypothetical protein
MDLLSYAGVDRDCIGDSALSGDLRWAGTYGVNLDFVARSHCSVEFISMEAMQVLALFFFNLLSSLLPGMMTYTDTLPSLNHQQDRQPASKRIIVSC